MSNEALNRVWSSSLARGSDLVVMLRLADRADEKFECFPGHKSLAKDCRLQVRQVKAILQRLKKHGEISWRRRPSADPKEATNLYRITLGTVHSAAQCTPLHGAAGNPVQSGAIPTCAPASDQGAAGCTQTLSEPPVEPSLGAVAPSAHEKVTRQGLVFEALAEVSGYNLAELTLLARGAINKGAKDIRAVCPGVGDVEIARRVRERARRYRILNPTWGAVTPLNLAKYWGTLDGKQGERRDNATPPTTSVPDSEADSYVGKTNPKPVGCLDPRIAEMAASVA